MNIFQTNLDGIFKIENKKFEDNRGTFIKTFHADIFKSMSLDTDFKESYYSVSKKNVLRGMHYQLSPHEHSKLVYVTDGNILDVAVDIRKDSKTFGRFFSTELSAENGASLYLAKGFAHGFLTLSDSATVVYLTTTVHAPEFDTGIRWNTFGFSWPEKEIKISLRDQSLPNLTDL